MITSILDNDLYKFTMQQAVRRLYPDARAGYRFVNRGGARFPGGFGAALKKEVEKMAGLALTLPEKAYLKAACPYFSEGYLDYLESYRFRPGEVVIKGGENGGLSMEITGPWDRAILWEVPLMALVSELYYIMTRARPVDRSGRKTLNVDKGRRLARHQVRFVDFGTRRRFSLETHKEVILDLTSVEQNTLAGTSNVFLARRFNLAPIGTLAHEWVMFHAILHGYKKADPTALDAWFAVYGEKLGIALSDTYTTPVFLSAFDRLNAERFGGVRQDSGRPEAFADRIISRYASLGIDPLTKTIVFSDGLDIGRAVAIHGHCKGRIQDVYGIGTHLTNDVGPAALNMVIKLFRGSPGPDAAWRPVVKLSDDKGKRTGNPEEIRRCLAALNVR